MGRKNVCACNDNKNKFANVMDVYMDFQMRLLKLEVCLQPVGLKLWLKVFGFCHTSILFWINILSLKSLTSMDEIYPCEGHFFPTFHQQQEYIWPTSMSILCHFSMLFLMCEDFKGLCILQMKHMELSSVVNKHKSNFRGGDSARKVIERCGYTWICQWRCKLLF